MTEEELQTSEQVDEFDLEGEWDKAHAKIDNPKSSNEEVMVEQEEKSEPKPEPVEEEKEEEPEAEDEPVVEKKGKPSAKEADAELKVAFEKLEKSYKDTQKAFHEDRKKLSAYKRAIKSFVDEGTLTEEESQTLLDHVQFENMPDNAPSNLATGSGLAKYASVIYKELQVMKRYSSNPQEIDLNTEAFQHLFDTSTWADKQEIIEELSGFEDDVVELTKQMLLLGARHNNEVYSEIYQSGGVKQLKEKYIKEIEMLKEELDKSKKQYVKLKEQHADYNEPTVINSPGGSFTPSSAKSGDLDIDKALDFAYRG
jgi:hypothetical protein